MSTTTPSADEMADEMLTTFEKRNALIQRAQRKDGVAEHYRRMGDLDLARSRRADAFEARKLAREL